MRLVSAVFAVLAACSEAPVYRCPEARTTLDGGCSPLGLRCAWSAPDASFSTYCTCAGQGAAGQWTCGEFRNVNADGCPVEPPATGEHCDRPTARACLLTGANGCRYRCECVPQIGVVTPPRWQCSMACPLDAGARDAPGDG